MNRRRTRGLVVGIAAFATFLAGSCGPRIEYRARPGFATEADLPDEVTLPDGTIIRYVSRMEYIARRQAEREGRAYRPRSKETPSERSRGADEPGYLSWEELDDGSVRMQAILPEEVVANTMRAFREERYVELWNQLVSEGTRRNAEADVLRRLEERSSSDPAQASDPSAIGTERPDAALRAQEIFVQWCMRSREQVLMLLNRMSFGFSTNGVIMRKTGPDSLSLDLAPQIAQDFRYRVVDVVFDRGKVYLGGIR